ncbi:MAG: hypothetical protein KDA32_01205 [Phycisphaerales bacterium]|nr:hypothetical protein [Phycisphaerales bacterium]
MNDTAKPEVAAAPASPAPTDAGSLRSDVSSGSTEDDLAAALAEVANSSPESKSAQPVASSAAAENDLETAPSEAGTSIEAGSQRYDASSIVGEDELAAALAEVGGAPSLDDSLEPDPPPGPDPEAQDDLSGALAEIASAGDEGAEDAPAPDAGRKLRFQVGKKAPPVVSSADGATAASGEVANGGGTTRLRAPRISIFKRAYRALDRGLECLARPLANAPESVRRVIGRAALAWLALAALVILSAPFIVGGRDAVSFLNDKVAELKKPVPQDDAAK